MNSSEPNADQSGDDRAAKKSPSEQAHTARMRRIEVVKDRQLAEATIEKGLIVVHTGAGKGKSTAAFGMALRSLGQNMRVAVVQFIKGAIATGEAAMIEKLAQQGWPIEMHTLGEGFTWKTQDRQRDIATAAKAWQKAVELIRDPAIDLVILDEINIAIKYEYVTAESVLEELRNKRDMLHVVLTGRNASPAIIEIADLVSEMKVIKHPYARGIKPQKGVEF